MTFVFWFMQEHLGMFKDLWEHLEAWRSIFGHVAAVERIGTIRMC